MIVLVASLRVVSRSGYRFFAHQSGTEKSEPNSLPPSKSCSRWTTREHGGDNASSDERNACFKSSCDVQRQWQRCSWMDWQLLYVRTPGRGMQTERWLSPLTADCIPWGRMFAQPSFHHKTMNPPSDVGSLLHASKAPQ